MSDEIFKSEFGGLIEAPSYDDEFALYVWHRYLIATEEFDRRAGARPGDLPDDLMARRACLRHAKALREETHRLLALQGVTADISKTQKWLAERFLHLPPDRFITPETLKRIVEDIEAMTSKS